MASPETMSSFGWPDAQHPPRSRDPASESRAVVTRVSGTHPRCLTYSHTFSSVGFMLCWIFFISAKILDPQNTGLLPIW